jgi:hypothetical protein
MECIARCRVRFSGGLPRIAQRRGSLCIACTVATEVFRADEAKDQAAVCWSTQGLCRQCQPPGRPRPEGLRRNRPLAALLGLSISRYRLHLAPCHRSIPTATRSAQAMQRLPRATTSSVVCRGFDSRSKGTEKCSSDTRVEKPRRKRVAGRAHRRHGWLCPRRAMTVTRQRWRLGAGPARPAPTASRRGHRMVAADAPRDARTKATRVPAANAVRHQ